MLSILAKRGTVLLRYEARMLFDMKRKKTTPMGIKIVDVFPSRVNPQGSCVKMGTNGGRLRY